ncbi:MAG: Fur family transcriptional regulator [Campylobacterota bacterium]|nr:Fur family transcriptional regulator [Campylobacterota bacterium]
MNNFTNILREHNLKATPQRLAMLEFISIYGHINVDRLYENIKNRFSSISLATIYKNINSMIDNKLLFEVKLPNKKSVYEITKNKHSHLLCENCGDIIDIEVNIDDKIQEIIKNNNFNIKQSDLVFSGICKDCKK